MTSTTPASAATAGTTRRGDYARSQDTRRRIIAAALAEAGVSGFHKTSVARIAARAGVAVGVLNYHFGSKDELLAGLMTSLTEDLQARFEGVENAPAGFFEHERAGLLVYLGFLHANPAYLRLLGEVRTLAPETYRQAISAWVDQFAERVHAGIAAGEVRALADTSVRTYAHFVLGSYLFLDQLLEVEPYPGDPAVADHLVTALRSTLGTRPAV